MKSIPLVAFLLAALCTVGAITAYVLVGRTEAEEPLRAALRRPAVDIAETVEVKSHAVDPHAGVQPHRAARVATSVQIERAHVERTIVTPFVNAQLPASTPDSTETAQPPVHAFATPRLHSHPATIHLHSARTSSSPISSKPSASPEVAQPLRKESSTQRAPASAKDDEKPTKPVSPVSSETATPDTAAHSHRTSAPAKQRPAWPRGNFTVEQERLRAQIGWQAFADEIFENSINPPQDVPAQ